MMARGRKLKGVAHNIMDHAVGALGYLMPGIFDYCATSGQRQLTIDLLKSEPIATAHGISEALALSAANKHEKFLSILSTTGLDVSLLSSATLQFEVLGDPRDKWPRFTCQCIIETCTGKVFRTTMDSATYWTPKREDPFEFLRRIRSGG